jgi:hypothetical protein
MADDRLARRVVLAALELQAGRDSMWIAVGAIAERIGVEGAELDAAITRARLAGWLSVGGVPPISVLPKQGRLREMTGTEKKR